MDINILNEPFNDKPIYGKGGFYYCHQKDIKKWICYNGKLMYYIWDVAIPNDAKIIDMGDKLKTDKFILSNRRCIWNNYEICKLAVKQNGLSLCYVKDKTREICKLYTVCSTEYERFD